MLLFFSAAPKEAFCFVLFLNENSSLGEQLAVVAVIRTHYIIPLQITM